MGIPERYAGWTEPDGSGMLRVVGSNEIDPVQLAFEQKQLFMPRPHLEVASPQHAVNEALGRLIIEAAVEAGSDQLPYDTLSTATRELVARAAAHASPKETKRRLIDRFSEVKTEQLALDLTAPKTPQKPVSIKAAREAAARHRKEHYRVVGPTKYRR